ncbi:nuclear transport factor 2 family protein [Flavobacterium microcysteis]|uniref:Nuclear transport factor 2 family protein n=1 Tax=Flavobacterium microcysteis TaxID=2596891 RepID=A0A501PZH7_9FLAO|nr:nuclear transport factor 2 family protein [Flavobacterium microcysteis]TPD65833.1 nuclear transport factor 2 family protein [Flavobacterium microcysteis]
MTKTEILNQENKLYKAIQESDIVMLDELLHEDLLFVIPNGDVITKEMDLQTYRSGNIKINKLVPKIENLNLLGDLAVITLTIELQGSYHKEAFESKCRYIRFWKEFPEGIKVVGGSGMVIG